MKCQFISCYTGEELQYASKLYKGRIPVKGDFILISPAETEEKLREQMCIVVRVVLFTGRKVTANIWIRVATDVEYGEDIKI